jgi:predicted phage tail protein
MKVKIFGLLAEELQEEEFSFEVSSIKEVLSLLNLHKGSEFIKDLLENKYYYVLTEEKNPENSICLSPEIIFSEFKTHDMLLIVPEISGDIPVAFLAFALTSAGFSGAAAFVTAYAGIFAAIGNLIASVALSAVMQLLSPTPEFTADPGVAQNASNLFNGAPMIRNQGGSVPLLYGNPYCLKPCGVLISSGVSTA